jgi:NADH dehydrogenase
MAASVKELVCKGTVWGLRKEGAKPGWYRWLKGGNRPAPVAVDQQAALR